MALSPEVLVEAGWDTATIDDWLLHAPGINAEDAIRWHDLGVDAETAAWYDGVRPSIAQDWVSQGFTVAEMVRCHHSRVTLARALQWRAAGRSLDDTVLWASHGFSPTEAEEWSSTGHDVRSAHSRRSTTSDDAPTTWVSTAHPDVSLEEPIDVPDEARDRRAELAEMWPHLRDPEQLGDLWSEVEGPSS